MQSRVCAVVVTYRRQQLLRVCLDALRAQTRPPDEVLVVENGSNDGTLELLRDEYPEVRVVVLEQNAGASGGFYAGMSDAVSRGFDSIWIMDDDAQAAPDCLERLVVEAAPNQVTVPVQQDDLGRFYGAWTWNGAGTEVAPEIIAAKRPRSGRYMFAFVGCLIPAALVKSAGLPYRDFFIWFDDWEYSLRLHKHGADVVVVPEAVLRHNVASAPRHARFLWRRSIRIVPAPWKLYYGTRNPLFFLLTSRRPLRELLTYFYYQQRWILSDLVYGPERFTRVGMRLRGLLDGAFGRMGKRISAS